MTDATAADNLSTYRDAVVVGFDGSVDAARAVRWAAADAQRRGARLVVLRAWSLKTTQRPVGADFSYTPSEDEYSAAVVASIKADLAGVLSTVADVVPVAVHQPAEEALVRASQHAAVTVVGARGAGLASWLGSVSASVVRHGQGPIVVVPERGERKD